MMKFVCRDCFGDEGLREFVELNAESTECSFCRQISKLPIAADIWEAKKHFRQCVELEYDDAANHLGYESAEGGYYGACNWDSHDLIVDELELDLPNDDSGELFNELLDSLDDIRWCRADPFSLNPYELTKFSWDEFCRVVKHERRFFFMRPRSEQSEENEKLTPAKLLDRIVEYSKHQELFVELTPDVLLFRSLPNDPGSPLTEPRDLGPPPDEKAQQSRMSPAGISMLYVSDNPLTALAEKRADSGEFSVGCFRLKRPALILDLSSIPPIPSLFAPISDIVEYFPREILIFLHTLQEEISRSIPQDNLVHLEYVPTQVITEYLKCLPPIFGRSVEGIKYPSSVASGHWSAAIFATQRNIEGIERKSIFEDGSERWIRLESVKTFDLST